MSSSPLFWQPAQGDRIELSEPSINISNALNRSEVMFRYVASGIGATIVAAAIVFVSLVYR